MDITRYTAVMVSCVPRAAIRQRTLMQLAAQGITPRVFVRSDLPVGYANLRANAEDALRAARATGDICVYLEDDLTIAHDLAARLPALCAATRFVLSLCVLGRQFYPAAVRRVLATGAQPAPGILPLVNVRRYYGAQALLLTPAAIDAVLTDWPPSRPFDCRVGDVCAQQPGGLVTVVPNPVQHAGADWPGTFTGRVYPGRFRSLIWQP